VIHVSSEPEKGTSFTVFFPALELVKEKKTEASKSLPKGKEHILFVDDEEAIRLTYGEQLKRLGYQITTAENGRKALDEFQVSPARFDLVITDQSMPQMEGIALAKAVKKIRPDIPLILCSGYSDILSDEDLKAAEISEILTKPIVKSHLAGMIRKALDKPHKDEAAVRILLIDDDDDVRSTLKQILEREGYRVLEASDGNQGLKIFKEKPIDLIITDLIMPEKDGMEIIIEIQRDYPKTKLIAISGGGKIGAEHYLEIAKRTGAMLTLQKPVERKSLLEAIQNLLPG